MYPSEHYVEIIGTLFARHCGRIRSTISLPRSASILEGRPVRSRFHSMASDFLLQIFAKHNKNYQNVNSKRLQLKNVYLLTLNDHLAC
jgi:hypothetical protein